MTNLDEISPEATGHTGGGVSVLVVDDEASVRRLIARVLEREGYTVLEAADGADALELIRVKAARVDVVVSDIVMPRLNGVELMQELAASHADLPVILISGYATAELAELGIATPCSILTKPLSAERLLAEVHRCVHMTGGTSGPRPS